MSTSSHTDDLGVQSIGRLLFSIALPASVALFVTSTYNLVDAVFVGRGVGPDAIGALTLIMPFQMLVTAFGSMLAIGASSIVSRSFGAGETRRAKSAAGTALAMAASVGIAVALLGRVFMEPVLDLLGAEEGLVAPTREYFALILFVEPLLLLNVTGESLIRSEGQARVAMAAMVAGMLLNIALDPLFIFVFGWGVSGAAMATILGRILSWTIIVTFLFSSKSSLGLRLRNLRPRVKIFREIAAVGSSGLIRQLSDGIVYLIGNNLLMKFGDAMYVTAYGAVFRVVVFLGMPALGVAMAVPPIAGYNYGAGRYDRVRKVVITSILASTALMLIGFTLFESVPQIFLRLFTTDLAMIATGVDIIRVKAPVMLVFPAYMIGTSFYQALGRPAKAFVISLTRPLFSIVVMFSAVRSIGAMAVVSAEPIAVALGALIAIILLRRDMKNLGVRSA